MTEVRENHMQHFKKFAHRGTRTHDPQISEVQSAIKV